MAKKIHVQNYAWVTGDTLFELQSTQTHEVLRYCSSEIDATVFGHATATKFKEFLESRINRHYSALGITDGKPKIEIHDSSIHPGLYVIYMSQDVYIDPES